LVQQTGAPHPDLNQIVTTNVSSASVSIIEKIGGGAGTGPSRPTMPTLLGIVVREAHVVTGSPSQK